MPAPARRQRRFKRARQQVANQRNETLVKKVSTQFNGESFARQLARFPPRIERAKISAPSVSGSETQPPKHSHRAYHFVVRRVRVATPAAHPSDDERHGCRFRFSTNARPRGARRECRRDSYSCRDDTTSRRPCLSVSTPMESQRQRAPCRACDAAPHENRLDQMNRRQTPDSRHPQPRNSPDKPDKFKSLSPAQSQLRSGQTRVVRAGLGELGAISSQAAADFQNP